MARTAPFNLQSLLFNYYIFGGGEMSADQEVNDLELEQFSRLPSGWQRVIIAVVFVVILVGVVLLKQMISTEEDVRHDEDML
jgi:hypothetical protein